MPFRFRLALVGAAGVIVGVAIGLLTARRVDSNWFEAVGTWVGALISAAAVVLAILVFRSDDFMRRMELARDTQREAEARRAAEKQDQLLADSVVCFLRFGSGNQYPDRWVARALHISVQNNTDDRTVTNIEVLYPPLYGENWRTLSTSLRPGEQYMNTEYTKEAIEMKPSDDDLKGRAEFRYSIGGDTWTRHNGTPPRRL